MEATLKEYCRHRLAGDHEKLLALCTDDFTIVSERDGTHKGREQILAYLSKVKPQGTWEAPRRISETRFGVQGTVRFLFLDVHVVGYYDFDLQSGKICRVEGKRGTLPTAAVNEN